MAMAFAVLQFSNAQNDAGKIQSLLNSALNFDNAQLSVGTPIQSVNRIASQQADTTLILSRESMAAALNFAKGYSKGIITESPIQSALLTETLWMKTTKKWSICLIMKLQF